MPFDAPLQVVLASAAVAAALPLLFWGLAGLGRRRRRPSLEAAGESRQPVDEHQLHLQQPALPRLAAPVLRAVARRVRKLTPAGWVAALERRLRLAGSPRGWPVDRTLALKLLLAVSTLLLGGLWVVRFPQAGGSPVMTAARIAIIPLLAMMGYLLPDLALRFRGRDRQQAIETSLPDALDQMSISVEAGLGFDAALGRVVESGRGPLVEELQRTLQEIAKVTGGAYFRATDTNALEEISKRIGQLEKTQAEARTAFLPEPLYRWPLGVAIAALFALGLFPEGRKRFVSRTASA